MQKLEDLLKVYEGSLFEALPSFMKRRVDALKKIQLEHIQIQHQYNLRIQELELEFEKLYQPLYEKRAKIISGEHEPTEEECQLPTLQKETPPKTEQASNGDHEHEKEQVEPILTKAEEAELKSKVKGLPAFWLGCLNSTYNFSDSIESYDRPVLRHLKDIRLLYQSKGDCLIYKLEFHFDENPYFTNEVLTKTYHLKSSPDEKDPFSYEGYEVFKSEGCNIDWKPGKDVTIKTVTVKQKNKTNGQTREKKKDVERDSFFYFFKPPQMPEGNDEEMDSDLGDLIALDFELGEMIRQGIIPKAALYYTGHMMDEEEDEDDDDDDEEEDDDDDDDDDDDSDGLEYDSDLEASDDSINNEPSENLIKRNAAKKG